MNAPVRKPVVPAEATQELQAADVLEVLGTKPAAKMGSAVRRPMGSQSSIAPVGLDLAGGADADDDDDDRHTNGHVIPPPGVPGKRFKGLVIGVVSGCALILVAAGIARVVHASDEPMESAAHASTQAVPTAQAQTAAATTPAATAPAASPASLPAPAAAAPPDGTSVGTVRLDKPAKAGHVWIDGKKITSSSAVVSCGTHRIKIGHGRTHSFDVPCGGEIGVSR